MPVICSDCHIDTVTSGVERFDDLKAALVAPVEAARNNGPFIFLGDWSDPNNDRSVRAEAYAIKVASELQRMGVFSIFLSGNHDVVEDGHNTHTLLPLKYYAEATGMMTLVLDRPQVLNRDEWNYQIIALPYTARAADYDPGEFIRRIKPSTNPKKRIVILGHLDCEGITPGSEILDMPRGRKIFWPTKEIAECFPEARCFGGHIHQRQVFKKDGVEIQIVGSLDRLSYSEEHSEPGYLEVEL